MTKTLSAAAYASLHAPESGEAWIWLLTIDHPSFVPSLRFARNWRPVTSRGDVYIPFPFVPSIAQEEPDRPPRLQIQIGNVSRVVTAKLESIAGTDSVPMVTLEVVLASQPSVVEYVLTNFEMKHVGYDQTTVKADLEVEDWFSAPYPDLHYTPVIAPGAHRR